MSKQAFERILLATEHTEFDTGAEKLAFAMAKSSGQALRVVFPLLSNPEYEAEMPEFALHAEEAVAEKIEHLRAEAGAVGVTLEVVVRRGSERHSEIVAEAGESNSNLIIVRRRGKPGFFSRMLIGDMVSRTIHDATCNVLMVPRKAQMWKQSVLVAVGDTPDSESIVKTAAMVAQASDLPLTVLSVASDDAGLSKVESLNTLNVALASAKSVQGEVRVGEVVEQTQAALKETGADLLVIGRQRYHLLPFTDHGYMHQIVGKMDVPVLVVPTNV